ncbi:hypothetical protein AWZ03_014336 [Drosophila navojoa]|uniref:Fibrinogen C-terminal domain-containing protein n=1 Tax=Drosophila navojoa TaxID=7232 RepID=A0A484AUG7_DRONA|nr:fibrinogen-like protein 1 [Drosophila navojoa]TDG39241.1 hypothetical protein AWZ03_014336 [Drosophila navojoa]
MKRGNLWIILMIISVIPCTFSATVSVLKKKEPPVKDCTRDIKNKSEMCHNTTEVAVPLVNQTVTPKPKLAEFQIDAHKTISISKDDLNDLLDVYMDKLAENAATIHDKETEIIKLQSGNKSDEDQLKKYQEQLEACQIQNTTLTAALSERDEQIKALQLKTSVYETRLKRKQNLLALHRKQNATNAAAINELKARVKVLAYKLRERKDDLLADWEAATNSCLPHNKMSGIHLMQLPDFRPFLVACEGNGWTVIQRRFDGSVNFYRNWNEYRNGFGKLNGEFFIGLEKLYRLTAFQPHELFVSLRLFNGSHRVAFYDDFVIGSESEGYELKLLGNFHGNASDAMRTHDKMKFSTYDRDHDEFTHINCAEYHHGAWWYDFCSRSNLNGKYFKTQTDSEQGIFWDQWYSFKSLKSVQMQIRPKNAKT